METYSRDILIGPEKLFNQVRNLALHAVGLGLFLSGMVSMGRSIGFHNAPLASLWPIAFVVAIGIIVGALPFFHSMFINPQTEHSVVEILADELENGFESEEKSGFIFQSSMEFLAEAAQFYLAPLEQGTSLSETDVEFIKQIIAQSADASKILSIESHAQTRDFDRRKRQVNAILNSFKSESSPTKTENTGPAYRRIILAQKNAKTPPGYSKKITDVNDFLNVLPAESSKDENFANGLMEACSVLYLSSLIISMFSPIAWKHAFPNTLKLMDAVMDYLDRSGPFLRNAEEIRQMHDKLKKSTDRIYLSQSLARA